MALKYYGILGRLEILRYLKKEDTIYLRAGEAWYEFYDVFLPQLKSKPGVKLEIAIGPEVSHYPDAAVRYIDDNGKLKKDVELDDLKYIHPVFRFLLLDNGKNQDRIKIYINYTPEVEARRKGLKPNLHYALCEARKVTFIEEDRSVSPPEFGSIYFKEELYKKKMDDFNKLKEKFCKLFSLDNDNWKDLINSLVFTNKITDNTTEAKTNVN